MATRVSPAPLSRNPACPSGQIATVPAGTAISRICSTNVVIGSRPVPTFPSVPKQWQERLGLSGVGAGRFHVQNHTEARFLGNRKHALTIELRLPRNKVVSPRLVEQVKVL